MAGNVVAALKAAVSKVGTPYVYGAAGPSSFDCSGLTSWAWRQAGVTIPRTSQAQAKYGTAVSPKNIKPGDLVTSNWGGGPASHVALYIGGGKVVHAPRPGRDVTVAKLDELYRSKVDAIRRVPKASYAGLSQADLKIPSPGELFDWEKGWAEDLLGAGGDLAGGLADGAAGLGDALLAPLKQMGEQLASIAGSIASMGQFAEFLMKLALPSTWVRIACGVMGVMIMLLGVGFLIREARGAA